ncbi:TIGR03943 family putative permease subunit [Microbacterium sp. P01]|uniref:TIGR03943 family putative permease subunit n=1 Tax=unclassified Microbacterium TaxID=2609290 RepID=UPI00366F32DD
MRDVGFLGTRWLGVGLAACLSVVTISLALTGQLGLYINPDSAWFAVGMAVLVLIGTILSFALPLGAEADHGHDHDEPAAPRAPQDEATHAHDHAHRPARPSAGTLVAVTGGVAASAVVACIVLLPPASLSAELAMSRDVGAAPLFAGQDAVTLASTGDTSSFGVGDWATVFATATNPDAFDGDAITLTGFATPVDGGDGFQLTRLVITHCVIDAQPASVPIVSGAATPETGQWITITGTVRATSEGGLEIDAQSIDAVEEPKDPYEY